MKKGGICWLLLALFIGFNSCKEQVKSSGAIKNGIEIKEEGLQVETAFITNSDESEISADNKVTPGERVCLRMIIKGWQEKNGIVFLDASQKVTTDKGVLLTSNPSVFGISLFNGTAAATASHVVLYQTIGKVDKPVDYILISFKVWDKLSNKSVSGSYKVYM